MSAWLLGIIQLLTALHVRDTGAPVSYPDCGDRSAPCATFDDGPAGDGWYVLAGGAHVRLPAAPDQGHRDGAGVQWWTWSGPRGR